MNLWMKSFGLDNDLIIYSVIFNHYTINLKWKQIWFVYSLDHELQLLALLGVDLHGDLHGTVGYEAGQLPLLQLLAVHRDQGVLVTPGEKYFIFTTKIFANDNDIGNSDRCLHDLTINVGCNIALHCWNQASKQSPLSQNFRKIAKTTKAGNR